MSRPTPAPRRRGDTAIKLMIALVIAVAGLGAWKMVGPSSQWLESVGEGMEAAESTGQPIFVLFTADWCPPCKRLKREVLGDPEVSQYLQEEFVQVKIDLTDRRGENNRVAAEYGVRYIPSIKIYSDRGEYIDTYNGEYASGEFLMWLRRIRRSV